MKSILEDKLSMYLAVQQVCNEYPSAVGAVEAFKTAYSGFSKHLEEIQTLRLLQDGSSKGYTTSKAEEREELANSTVKIANAMTAYAKAKGNHVLLERSKLSKSKILQARDTETIALARQILETASGFVQELAAYGIKPVHLTTLETNLKDYESLVNAPRNAIGKRAEATQQLEELFKGADELLRGAMDLLIDVISEEYPAFVGEYRRARQIF